MFKGLKCAFSLLLLSFSPSLFAQETLHLYAASSMTNAVNELIKHYQASHTTRVVPVFGGSSSLARQVERGAPADLFLAASDDWARYLIDKQDIGPEHVTLIAGNRVVLIQPATASSAPFDVADSQQWLQRLAKSRLAVGNTEAVPIGIYAQQVLDALDVWDGVRPHLAPTNNARSALALVERGEVALGMVYQTDAQSTDKVTTLTVFDDSLHDTIHYPLLRLSDKSSNQTFIDYVTSPVGKSILARYGFTTDMEHEQFAQ
ncbi:molybdate ABC transporter substrate-binding protein [Vibrio metschnikovii]|nr:molybdate ABC transporter substrate-binding protein [Vibrio metschnikovii]